MIIPDISDESVVEQWSENAYYQYFCGESSFSITAPCNPTELVHFRHRMGQKGIELIFKESIRICQDDDSTGNKNHTAFIDSTVQEKNITFPTDAKAHKRIIKRCQPIALDEGLSVRQRYTRTLHKFSIAQRFRNHYKNKGQVVKADRKVKTIAGRLIRELERNLQGRDTYAPELELYKRILSQKCNSKDKIYSLYELEVECISNGKEYEKYELGNKVSIVRSIAGIIIGALSFRKQYDGHTVELALEQVERLVGSRPAILAGDRGYRGRKYYDSTTVVI